MEPFPAADEPDERGQRESAGQSRTASESVAQRIPLWHGLAGGETFAVRRRGALGRTTKRMLIHLFRLFSNLLGDDFVSKSLRRGGLRLLGAQLGHGTIFHGGTEFTQPANLRAGRDCFINRSCYLDLEGTITIGDRVVIGHGTTLVTTRHEIGGPRQRSGASAPRPISIGSGAWLGANVTVLPGVSIGEGAVVGAGAVVTQDVPCNVLVAGVPASLIRRLAAAEASTAELRVLEPGGPQEGAIVDLPG